MLVTKYLQYDCAKDILGLLSAHSDIYSSDEYPCPVTMLLYSTDDLSFGRFVARIWIPRMLDQIVCGTLQSWTFWTIRWDQISITSKWLLNWKPTCSLVLVPVQKVASICDHLHQPWSSLWKTRLVLRAGPNCRNSNKVWSSACCGHFQLHIPMWPLGQRAEDLSLLACLNDEECRWENYPYSSCVFWDLQSRSAFQFSWSGRVGGPIVRFCLF